MLEPRNRKMRLFARMVESADTEVSKTSALGRVGSSPTLSTSKFSVYKTLNRIVLQYFATYWRTPPFSGR